MNIIASKIKERIDELKMDKKFIDEEIGIMEILLGEEVSGVKIGDVIELENGTRITVTGLMSWSNKPYGYKHKKDGSHSKFKTYTYSKDIYKLITNKEVTPR